MYLIRNLDELPASLWGGALSIGNFDGVHLGHREIVQCLVDRAGQLKGPAVVFTFDPHPIQLLRPDQAPSPLTWMERKVELLAEVGVDAVIAYPTDQKLLNLHFRDFFQSLVLDRLGSRAIVEGPNFHFGKNREGTIKHLAQLCQEFALEFEVVSATTSGDQLVSSSRIRQLLIDGDVGEAYRMLVHPYRLRGHVIHGDARGTQVGFPTANLAGIDTLIPGEGVYVGRAFWDDCWRWSAIHIGPSPTFAQPNQRVEVHVLDFQGSLYGQTVQVEFFEKIRGVKKFDSSDELIQQLRLDVNRTREVARNHRA